MPLTNFPNGVDVKTLSVNGADVSATVAPGSVAGAASGYVLARGEGTLDGTNPTPVASGLTTIISATVTLKGSAAPGVGTSSLTAVISGTNINVYAWKVTSDTDTTLVASTGTEGFYWTAVGT